MISWEILKDKNLDVFFILIIRMDEGVIRIEGDWYDESFWGRGYLGILRTKELFCILRRGNMYIIAVVEVVMAI